MDNLSYFSYIPKVAVSVLIIIGILIVIEVINLTKGSKKKEKEEKLEEKLLDPVTFPKNGVSLSSPVQIKHPRQINKRSILLGIIILVIAGLGAVVSQYLPFFTKSLSSVSVERLVSQTQPTPEIQTEQTPEQVTSIPSPTAAEQLLPKIIIYQIDEEGVWQELQRDDLPLLTPGEEIRVAVFSTVPHVDARFTINGEIFIASDDQKTPFGDLYITYPIQPGVLDYHIEVVLF